MESIANYNSDESVSLDGSDCDSFSDIKEYFDSADFEEMCALDKKAYRSQKERYELSFTANVEMQEPGFMKIHRAKTLKRQAAADKKEAKRLRAETSKPTSSRQSARLDKLKNDSKVLSVPEPTVSQPTVDETEEPFPVLKEFFTPSVWSKMNLIAKRHAQAAMDCYSAAVAKDLNPVVPKFMAWKISSNAGNSTVCNSGKENFERDASSQHRDIHQSAFLANKPAHSAQFESSFDDIDSPADEDHALREISNNSVLRCKKSALSNINKNAFGESSRGECSHSSKTLPKNFTSHNSAEMSITSAELDESFDLSETIKNIVCKIVVNIPVDVLDRIVESLDEHGVESVEDLGLVEASWITDAGLKTIQAKKILTEFSRLSSEQGTPEEKGEKSGKKKPKKVPLLRDFEDDDSLSSVRSSLSSLQIPAGALDMTISFGNFRESLLVSLEKKERPSSLDRMHMVKVLSQEMYLKYEEIKKSSPTAMQKTPGREVYKKIVNAIFEDFAFAFEDRINGNLIKDGKYSLTDQIETCVENKYRPKTCGQERSRAPARGNRSAACILPNKFSPPLSKASKVKAEEIRRELAILYNAPKSDWDWEHIRSRLVQDPSLAAQRNMINSKQRDMELIVEKWPFLFEVSGLICHLDNITGSSLLPNFEKFVDQDMDDLLEYLNVMSPQRVKIIKVGKDVAVGNGPLIHRKLMGIISMLTIHWGEDLSALISCAEETTLPHEVDVSTGSPHIVALGANPYLAKSFYLTMDGVCVCSNISNAMEAVMALCAAYFVFGILYPCTAGATMTYVERAMANLSDGSGLVKAQTAKGAVASSSHTKCQTLQQSIENFLKEMAGDE